MANAPQYYVYRILPVFVLKLVLDLLLLEEDVDIITTSDM